MQENKFRAWDTTSKKMYDSEKIGEYTLKQLFRLSVTDDPYTKFMQYTGLKEKNGTGKEICQGDLVRAYGHGIGEAQKNHWGEWVLVFEDSVETIHDLMMEQDLGEIIGTKYENPELLEVVK